MSPTLKAALLNLAKLIQQEAQPLPGKPARHKRKSLAIKHMTLLEPAQAQPKTPVQGRTAVIRDGLIVVTYPDKQAYLANPVPKDVFGFSGKAKEWRASLKWVRQNRPEILVTLGLN
jgi:hypothetical protein